jgi:hypothetical protein
MTEPATVRYVTLSRVLLLIGLVMFILAAFGVSFGAVGLVPLGLASLAAAWLA